MPPAIGEKGAKVRCAEIEKSCRSDLLSTITAKKVDEAKRGGDISAHRVLRAPAIVLEVRTPLRRERSGGMNSGLWVRQPLADHNRKRSP